VAAVTLLHPAHAPAAAALVLLAAVHAEPRRRRLVEGGLILALGFGVASVWLLPLVAHLSMALPLAWGDMSLAALGWRIVSQPILIVLALLGLAGWRLGSPGLGPGGRWLLPVAPTMAALVALDALVAAPLGITWLPADRLMDGLHLSLVLGGALGWASVASRFARPGMAALLALAACVPLSWGPDEPGLSLWLGERQWPKEHEVVRGLRVDALWDAIRSAPPGRLLFLRSGVPLDWRPEWWRPHTHITALTPLRAGRSMVGGTFTHPSAVAGLLYTGSAANRPLTLLAEQRDGRTLFGRPLEQLDPETFNHLARRLGISTVIALDEDVGRSMFLNENQEFERRSRIGSFNIFVTRESRSEPTAIGPQRWRVDVPPARAPGWLPVPIAYSPLWVARTGQARLGVRPDDLGLLEVELPPGAASVELEHRPGVVEWAGVGLSVLSLAVLILAAIPRPRYA
jgi:hypothetical protein